MSVVDQQGTHSEVASRFSYRPLGLLVLAQLVLGIVLGLIWLAWSPHSVAYNLDLGSGQGVIVPGEGESLVAADGRFVVLTAIAGLLFGLLAWQLRQLRGRVTLVVLIVSSAVASVLAKYTGQLLSGGHSDAAINTAFRPHLTLHANAALFMQPLLAALVYTIFVGLTGDPELGRPGPAPAALTEGTNFEGPNFEGNRLDGNGLEGHGLDGHGPGVPGPQAYRPDPQGPPVSPSTEPPTDPH